MNATIAAEPLKIEIDDAIRNDLALLDATKSVTAYFAKLIYKHQIYSAERTHQTDSE